MARDVALIAVNGAELLVPAGTIEARRLETHRLEVKHAAAAALRNAVQVAHQPCPDTLAAERRVHPHLLHLAAEPPCAADHAAHDFARRREPRDAGKRADLMQLRRGGIGVAETSVDERTRVVRDVIVNGELERWFGVNRMSLPSRPLRL